jgi:hypothetical protein
MNPNTMTAPIFRTTTDAELTAKIYGRVPVLIDEAKGAAGNPWGVSFMRMFDMSNDSGLFRTAAQLWEAGFVRIGSNWDRPEGLRPRQSALDLRGGSDGRSLSLGDGVTAGNSDRFVPLYEAKMIHHFDHRAGTFHGFNTRPLTGASLPSPSLSERQVAAFEVEPWYWVPEQEVEGRLNAKAWSQGWLMGWRDICRSTDERTLISGLSQRAGYGDKFLLMLSATEARLQGCLYACLNSLVCDFVARQKLGGSSFKYFTMKQIAILPPTAYARVDLGFIVPRVLELTYTSHAMTPFARDLGYNGPPFAWDEDRRALLRAELDAWYARAYGLTRDELRYILDPADVMGPDYPSETFRVLKKNEIARWSEYRTARLVLAAWDAQEARPAAAE